MVTDVSSRSPDLEEFLSTLNGFLSRPSTPADPAYVKSLEVFFRTVKAGRGHVLRSNERGDLHSVISYGLGEEFDHEFNRLRQACVPFEPSPLDQAYRQREPVAIVDLKKEAGIPPWFSGLMEHYGISALVAVPLIGKERAIGILCAYYEDVCLFDEGTLQHLMLLGRMVGGATEKTQTIEDADFFKEREKILDHLLAELVAPLHNKLDIYRVLADATQMGLQASGVISGPIVQLASMTKMSVAVTRGISERVVAHDVSLPPCVIEQLNAPEFKSSPSLIQPNEMGPLRDIIGATEVSMLVRPLLWAGEKEAAIVAWRSGGPAFDLRDFTLLSRMAGISAIALRAIAG